MPPPNRISSGRVKYYNKEGAREEMTQLYHRDFIDLVSNFNVGDRIRDESDGLFAVPPYLAKMAHSCRYRNFPRQTLIQGSSASIGFLPLEFFSRQAPMPHSTSG